MKGKECVEEVMSAKGIIRKAIKERGVKQYELAERLGMLQSSLSMGISREHIGLDLFSRILNGVGYSVAVIDNESGEVKWVVDPEQ